MFCLCEYIDSFANDIFSKLKKEVYFTKYSYEVKLEKLVELFADINALHPFREGNGRSQREFIEELAKINGIDLNLTTVSKDDMIVASHDSINGHYEKLLEIFKSRVFLCILMALIVGIAGVSAATYFPSGDVTYDNKESGLSSTDV